MRPILVPALAALCACTTSTPEKKGAVPEPKVTLTKEAWGATPQGKPVDLYTFRTPKGMQVRVSNFGATLVSVTAPDRAGKYEDVLLGHDNLQGYVERNRYFGSVVGRYGNRIAKGRFKLGGKEYKLAANNGQNHLHGGVNGFDKAVWNAKEIETQEGPGVEMQYVSIDGEEGYPGRLTATVAYSVNIEGMVVLRYSAITDKETVVNLTNHAYFNLTGKGEGEITGHVLRIDADRFTPVDSGLIPTGELRPVDGTPFDFRKPTAIGERINAADEQIRFGRGYDHNFVLNGAPGSLRRLIKVYEPVSGRVMEVETTEPGVQFYSGNFLDGSLVGKGGKAYKLRNAFCLETQHYPDSPNQPGFPSTVLKPGDQMTSATVFRFTTE